MNSPVRGRFLEVDNAAILNSRPPLARFLVQQLIVSRETPDFRRTPRPRSNVVFERRMVGSLESLPFSLDPGQDTRRPAGVERPDVHPFVHPLCPLSTTTGRPGVADDH